MARDPRAMDRLSFLIETRGYSKQELARRLGVSPTLLTLGLEGKRTLSSKAMKELSKLCSVSTDYLIECKKLLPDSVSTEDAEYLVQIYLNLDPEKKKRLLAYANALQIVESDPSLFTKPARKIFGLPDPDPEEEERDEKET